MSEHPTPSRRSLLKATGGALAGLSTIGVAAASETADELLEVNVGYASDRGRDAALEAADAVVHDFNFDALTITVPEQAVSGLQRNPNVRYVEENGEMHALDQETPWGVDRVGAPTAHDAGETGDGASVAIIDTGIDRTHPALSDNIGDGVTIVAGVSALNGQDDNGHGTHCAGTAVAPDDGTGVVGVATQSTLHPVKVLTAAGTGSTADVAAGIEYTADQGWEIGSLSLGGGESEALRDACEYATDRGVLLVAAAGNDGPCTDCVGYPAAYETVLAVSATDEDDDLAEFSSTGPEIELAAPGDDVYSTYLGGTYSSLSGTSMACPHVAGAAGQLIANGYGPEEAWDRLTDTAEDIGLEETEQGHGLLRVDDALDL